MLAWLQLLPLALGCLSGQHDGVGGDDALTRTTPPCLGRRRASRRHGDSAGAESRAAAGLVVCGRGRISGDASPHSEGSGEALAGAREPRAYEEGRPREERS